MLFQRFLCLEAAEVLADRCVRYPEVFRVHHEGGHLPADYVPGPTDRGALEEIPRAALEEAHIRYSIN